MNTSEIYDNIKKIISKFEELNSLTEIEILKEDINSEDIDILINKRNEIFEFISSPMTQLKSQKEHFEKTLLKEYNTLEDKAKIFFNNDKFFMNKINKRMQEIQKELKNTGHQNNKAVKGYIKQSYSL